MLNWSANLAAIFFDLFDADGGVWFIKRLFGDAINCMLFELLSPFFFVKIRLLQLFIGECNDGECTICFCCWCCWGWFINKLLDGDFIIGFDWDWWNLFDKVEVADGLWWFIMGGLGDDVSKTRLNSFLFGVIWLLFKCNGELFDIVVIGEEQVDEVEQDIDDCCCCCCCWVLPPSLSERGSSLFDDGVTGSDCLDGVVISW